MVLFLAKTADMRGVAVMAFESKIVNNLRVGLTSIIFESSSAPLDPIESSHICNSSKLSFTMRAEAMSAAPLDPIPDSENIISLITLFLFRISDSSNRHFPWKQFLLKTTCFTFGLFSNKMPRVLTSCSSHSTRWNSKFLKVDLAPFAAPSAVNSWEKYGKLSLEMFMFMEFSVSW
ncbi:hypothetical protein L6164_031043 [Bauhinia variegata]|uniref:Uncharacterized protein n=1 Tax=Bauhinia variegata TaxID=167791 RepID=A0ACB9LFK4_BAUVA|nr:hypothetical protein L6164_031043 [Bauhinia variegata]